MCMFVHISVSTSHCFFNHRCYKKWKFWGTHIFPQFLECPVEEKKVFKRGISYPGLSNPSCQSAILDIFSTPPSADPYASRDIGPQGGWLRKGEMSIKIFEYSRAVQVFGGICAHYSVPFIAQRGGVSEIFPRGGKENKKMCSLLFEKSRQYVSESIDSAFSC